MLKFRNQSLIKCKFKSFEFSDLSMSHCNTSLRVVIVYRPPPSKSNKSSLALFFEEFPVLLEQLVTTPSSLLIVGDFNFHVNDKSDAAAKRFSSLLDAFNLRQHIDVSTHRCGHTLDLVITRLDDNFARSFSVTDPAISDHFAVKCKLSLKKTSFPRKSVQFRNLKSVKVDQFRYDLETSPLLSQVEAPVDVTANIDRYNDILRTLLDKHAPMKERTITLRPAAPWYGDEIREQKVIRRKLERRWRASGLTVDRELYVNQCKVVNKCIFDSKMSYYTSVIDAKKSDQKVLFSNVNKLLHLQPSEKKLPSSDCARLLANNFASYFSEKIIHIRTEIDAKSSCGNDLMDDELCSAVFSDFKSVTADEVSKLTGSASSKSCALDPLPAYLLKMCIDLLLPVITEIINLSLTQGVLYASLKEAILTPLLKKASLDHELFENYRPISNLAFVSKCCEKVVASQLKLHLESHNLNECFQSAYKELHSTETALVRVQNDVLRSIDDDRCVILLLLDLSAAFDTVDHRILLSRLSRRFGISGKVYDWFSSYLSGRKQSVSVDGVRSSSYSLECGVPQSSVLGPILYLLYTSPLGAIMRRHGVSFHLYADDTQVYMSFKTSVITDMETTKRIIEACTRDIDSWMSMNKLKLKNDKTKLIVLHAHHRPLPPLDTILVGDDPIQPTESASNIGVIFDDTLTLEKQVTAKCRSCFYQLRNIARIRRFLSYDNVRILIHAFVISKLDYCNSLLYGLPKKQLQRLQYILNSAARLISGLHKFDHISTILIDLHWLPIEHRIVFKILLLTYKAINGLAPAYISDLLVPYQPCRALRSSSLMMLQVPRFKLESYGSRAFSVCAPRLWNSLPFDIKSCTSVDDFKRSLKTFLFKRAYFKT